MSGRIEWMEERLGLAARAAAPKIAHGEPAGDDERILEAVLLRLGFSLDEVRALVQSAAALPASSMEAMERALARLRDGQLRAARSARAGYDLNRHIAVSRAIRRFAELTGRPPSRPRPAYSASDARANRAASASRSAAIAAPLAACMRR